MFCNHEVEAPPPPPRPAWNYDLDACPPGATVQLLTRGGCGTTGVGMSAPKMLKAGFIAWCFPPARDPVTEERLGYRSAS